MKKTEQKVINVRVLGTYFTCKEEIQTLRAYQSGERLRHCTATVIRGNNGWFLKSYHTIVAYIPFKPVVHPLYGNIESGVCFDFLRYVYGYTATSAQHIAKFAHDYGNGKVLSYKEV